MDYHETLMQQQFVFVNPNAKKSWRMRDFVLVVMNWDRRSAATCRPLIQS